MSTSKCIFCSSSQLGVPRAAFEGSAKLSKTVERIERERERFHIILRVAYRGSVNIGTTTQTVYVNRYKLLCSMTINELVIKEGR